ncbi:hypothetical protein [Fluviicola sp.]|uniref:hypothetical protein n=1 Tax=Fluviicola sp. TaxID=1917219 RepID=UPI00283A16EA|nr:hypothetical protein [Fluviicola sp.]MDR0802066.1 hypothetical protein [Fluviicola sp.]
MKRFLLIIGLSLCSISAFSQQQVSNQKKTIAAPVLIETTSSQEHILDTVLVNSMSRTVSPAVQAEPVSRENQPASKGQPEPVLNTMKKKPE